MLLLRDSGLSASVSSSCRGLPGTGDSGRSFPERPIQEKGIFQNGPFCKIGFSRTGRSMKSDFPEWPVLEIPLFQQPVLEKSFPVRRVLARFPERAVLENPPFQNKPS